MRYAEDGDLYRDKETGVLRNLLGIEDEGILIREEANLSFLRANELHTYPVKGKFDLKHLQAIHRKLFGDVYGWAGEIRQVNLEKGTTVFARYAAIESAAKQLFGQLQAENHLQGLDPNEFSRRAGHYLGEINVLHPFREGNGRTQREFIRQLGIEAGHRIEWTGIDENAMIQASIAAYNGDSNGMTALIRGAIGNKNFLLINNDMSKQRLLVMNGSRLLETEAAGKWNVNKVEKAGALKPGIYNLYLATQADKTKSHDGTILYADRDSVYQQVGKNYVKHDRHAFDKVPDIGSNSSIKYEQERAQVTAASNKLGRGIS